MVYIRPCFLYKQGNIGLFTSNWNVLSARHTTRSSKKLTCHAFPTPVQMHTNITLGRLPKTWYHSLRLNHWTWPDCGLSWRDRGPLTWRTHLKLQNWESEKNAGTGPVGAHQHKPPDPFCCWAFTFKSGASLEHSVLRLTHSQWEQSV